MDDKYSLALYESQQTTKEFRAYLRRHRILFYIVLLALLVNSVVIYGLVYCTDMLGAETYKKLPTTIYGPSTVNTPYLEVSAPKHSTSTEVALPKEKIAEVTERGLSSSSCLTIYTVFCGHITNLYYS
jgi:hypothetical protein